MKLPYGETNNFPGRGGDTPDTLQYMARRLVIEDLKLRFFIEHELRRNDPHHVWYDREEVPLTWINSRLEADGHRWRADVIDDEYVFTETTEPTKHPKLDIVPAWLRRIFLLLKTNLPIKR